MKHRLSGETVDGKPAGSSAEAAGSWASNCFQTLSAIYAASRLKSIVVLVFFSPRLFVASVNRPCVPSTVMSFKSALVAPGSMESSESSAEKIIPWLRLIEVLIVLVERYEAEHVPELIARLDNGQSAS